ncbi:hypothetical protein RND71_009410 [Anisodus tanguticus]|uniref:Uncharacterized protein n=1 Tax=Anisodus tanguticus TaxID=243964 RepID=A0AAE1SHQ2_9SOLA|nr:hypothetical protein RND71_009410 [Anisodus tanguticus]
MGDIDLGEGVRSCTPMTASFKTKERATRTDGSSGDRELQAPMKQQKPQICQMSSKILTSGKRELQERREPPDSVAPPATELQAPMSMSVSPLRLADEEGKTVVVGGGRRENRGEVKRGRERGCRRF